MSSLKKIFVSFYAQKDVIARISGNSDWKKIKKGQIFTPKGPTPTAAQVTGAIIAANRLN